MRHRGQRAVGDVGTRWKFGLADLAIGVALVAAIVAIARRPPIAGTPSFVMIPWRWGVSRRGIWLGHARGGSARDRAALLVPANCRGGRVGRRRHCAGAGWGSEGGIFPYSRFCHDDQHRLVARVGRRAYGRGRSGSTLTLWLLTSPLHGASDRAGVASPRPRLLTAVARFVWLGMSGLCLVGIGGAYLAVLPPSELPRAELPQPNGYEDLQRASRLLNWQAIPSQDIDVASDRECQRFTQDNLPALAALREGFSKNWQRPVDYTDSNTLLPPIQATRELCRALDAEAESAPGRGARRRCRALLSRHGLGRVSLCHAAA